jgi:hypothetical protein
MSPRLILTGNNIDYHKHCRLEFGTYVQVREEHDNSMMSRTSGAIALRPTGNEQGGYYVWMNWTSITKLDNHHDVSVVHRSVLGMSLKCEQ